MSRIEEERNFQEFFRREDQNILLGQEQKEAINFQEFI